MSHRETRARLASSGGWGQVGSDDMLRYAAKAPNRRKRCRCGCGGALTHYGMANGVALMGGCEMSVYRWVRVVANEERK
jgi:hypothetical protein